ncbi:MAG: methyltransferase domain-containing protein [Deltaproteobacteria bacterium]|nr:methyltransferase domain-containing protein [Deltaproteobacteria bacterium]
MRDFVFDGPSLDLGCGDGIFSFIRAGGEFDYSFDMFKSVSNLDKFFDKVDIYDHFDERLVNPVVTMRPDYVIDVALDHKETLLKKSATLGLYKKLVPHDANKPLPFEDDSFNTIFSNMLYWLDSPEAVFKEIKRILRPGGKAAIMLPNSTFLEYSFYYKLYLKTKDPEWKWLERIDRGRIAENIKHAYDAKIWEESFKKAGLKVALHKQHLSKTVIEVWDIGLRPLFPVLHKMAGKLTESDRIEIKKEGIDLVLGLVEPLCSETWVTDKAYAPAFHYYLLTK